MSPKDVQEPWSPADATDFIREIAQDPLFSIAYKLHARERMAERGLITSDVLYVLKAGFVYLDPVPCEKTHGYYRYCIECNSPNSGGRSVRLVAIPSFSSKTIKLVTVMWSDEVQTRAGTITEGIQ